MVNYLQQQQAIIFQTYLLMLKVLNILVGGSYFSYLNLLY